MKKDFIRLVYFVCIATVFGGWKVLKAIFSAWWQLITISFSTVFPYLVEAFITSPCFIVGILTFLCSLAGIFLSRKIEKKLYKIISIIMGIISCISTLSGFLL